jgi:hypothetical protein
MAPTTTSPPSVAGASQNNIGTLYTSSPSVLAVTGGEARVLAAVSALLIAVGAVLLVRGPKAKQD